MRRGFWITRPDCSLFKSYQAIIAYKLFYKKLLLAGQAFIDRHSLLTPGVTAWAIRIDQFVMLWHCALFYQKWGRDAPVFGFLNRATSFRFGHAILIN
jgi:hypothetical protein